MMRYGQMSLSITGIEFDIQHAKNPLKFTHLQFKHLPGALGEGGSKDTWGALDMCIS